MEDLALVTWPQQNVGGRPRRKPEEYEAALLSSYASTGNLRRACYRAGVSPRTVQRRARSDRAFKVRIRSARKDYYAALEERLGELGFLTTNALPLIARLNAGGRKYAARYSQRAVEQSVTNNLTVNMLVAPEGVAEQMAAFRQGLQQPAPHPDAILDAEILSPALPAPAETP